MKGRTTLIIAHRLATIIHADQIFFLGKDKSQVPEHMMSLSLNTSCIKNLLMVRDYREKRKSSGLAYRLGSLELFTNFLVFR